jgi:PAS domain S-box-containing protein
MSAAPIPANEPQRLEALARYRILDTTPEEAFDEIVQLAASICGVPRAVISLVDESREWFKASVGIEQSELSRDISFCAHAILENDLFVIYDALSDPRFATNPLVVQEPRIRFYAGAQLTSPDGLNLGALCVIDHQPRILSDVQRASLRALARQVVVQLELRRQIAERTATEQKLQRVLEASNDGFWDWNVATDEVEYSPSFAAMLGFARDELAPHIEAMQRLVHPDDRERVVAEMKRHLAGHTAQFESEHRMRHKTDGWLWFLARGKVVERDRHGQPVRMAGTHTDITEPQKAEHELQRFFEVSIDPLCVVGMDGALRRLNPAFETVLGYTSAELTSKPLIEFVHPDDRDATLAEVERVTRGHKSARFENRYLTKSGEVKHFSWTATAIPQEQVIYAAARDITAMKLAEEALRRSNARTRSIIDNALGAIVTASREGVIESVNPAVVRIFGYSADELIGRDLGVLFADERDVAQMIDGALGRVTERRGRRRNGDPFACELSLFEFFGDDGRHLAAHLLDISEREAVDRLKRDFLSTVSHELRTPLTSVRGALTLLSSGLMGELDEHARQLVAVAERNSMRLISLINDILDFEKLDRGEIPIHRRPVALQRVFDRSVETLSAVAAQEGIAIEVESTHACVLADEERLAQVVVNLLSNAVKYSNRGTVVKLSASAAGQREVEVRVADRGRGIAAAAQHKIFDRFHQVDASDARTRPGTGLGLAICKAIIEQHGGTIAVESREGEGSTFSFRVEACP